MLNAYLNSSVGKLGTSFLDPACSKRGYSGICPAEFHTTYPRKVAVKDVRCGLLSHGAGIRMILSTLRIPALQCCEGGGLMVCSLLPDHMLGFQTLLSPCVMQQGLRQVSL